jgi:hypothetical protein
MPQFSLPPLTPDSPLAPISTLQAPGDIALELAVCELWASDDKVPLEALEVIRQEPLRASALIVDKISVRLSDYQYLHIPSPRGLNNSLIVLATLRHHSTATDILQICESDFGESLLMDSVELLPKTLGETIPDLTEWAALIDEFRTHDEYEWASVVLLIKSLPYMVHRTSTNRSDAARELIGFFDSAPDDLACHAATPTVLALLNLVVPETLPDALRINRVGLSQNRIPENQINAVFADPEGFLNAVLTEIAEERLSDAVKCFHYGPVYPPRHETPETIEDAIELLENNAGDATSLINANRRLVLEPEKSIPALLDYVKSKLFTEPLDGDDAEYPEVDEFDFGPAHAVRLLLELRCTAILPLLLPAFEVNFNNCLFGFEELVKPVLLPLVGQTAPSPEFVLEWIHRLVKISSVVVPLVEGLPAMVFDGRADRLHVISILRKLYFEVIASDDQPLSNEVANSTSQGLLALGDIDFVKLALQTADLPADSRRTILMLIGEDSEDLSAAVSEASGLITRCWFFEQRLITATEKLYEYMATQPEEDSDADGWGVEDDDDFDDDFGDDYEKTPERSSSSEFILHNSLPLAKLSLSPPDDRDFDDAPMGTSGTIRNTAKIGRNDPCPCGSGRKYKKCCGN